MVLEEVQSVFTSVLLGEYFAHKNNCSVYGNHTHFSDRNIIEGWKAK